MRYSDALLLDDGAADFPGLRIVMAHRAVPWVDTLISIAAHGADVFIGLSGWSLKYFPPRLVGRLSGLLARRVLYDSDFPVVASDRSSAGFAKLEVGEEVKPLVLKGNALALLGLGGPA